MVIKLMTDRDHHAWDTYVREHPEASPFHLLAWLKAVQETYGHKGFSLVAVNGQNE